MTLDKKQFRILLFFLLFIALVSSIVVYFSLKNFVFKDSLIWNWIIEVNNVTEDWIKFEYKKKGEESIKWKYCSISDCKINSKLENYLVSKGVKELYLNWNNKEINEDRYLKYNNLLKFENDKTISENTLLFENILYTFDKEFNIIKVSSFWNEEKEIINYNNVSLLLDKCLNSSFKDIKSCSKESSITLSYTDNWEDFILKNQLNENFSQIKDNDARIKETKDKVTNIIKELNEKKKEVKENANLWKRLFEVIKDY